MGVCAFQVASWPRLPATLDGRAHPHEHTLVPGNGKALKHWARDQIHRARKWQRGLDSNFTVHPPEPLTHLVSTTWLTKSRSRRGDTTSRGRARITGWLTLERSGTWDRHPLPRDECAAYKAKSSSFSSAALAPITGCSEGDSTYSPKAIAVMRTVVDVSPGGESVAGKKSRFLE